MSRPPCDQWDTEGAAWGTEGAAWDTSWHAEEDPTASGSWAEGPWEQSQTCHKKGHVEEAVREWRPHGPQPWSGDRRREKGNGYRPKANDPSGWSHGDNKPTEFEYMEMITSGKDGPAKKIKLMFKAYAHRESQKMGVEDRSSWLVNVLEREKAAKDAAAAGHETDMQHHLEAMERAHNELMDQAVEEMRAKGVRTVEVPVEVEVIKEVVVEVEVEVFKEVVVVEQVVVVQKVFVEVDVLPDGVERPPPLFKGGQSIHQWWASWMSGAYETPAGIRGKSGRPAWYSNAVYS